MDLIRMKELLEAVRAGEVSVGEACEQLKSLPYEDLDIAKLDHHRALRKGYPEVVYCQGKTKEHLKRIIGVYAEKRINMLLTRANEDVHEMAREIEPDVQYNALGRAVWRIYEPLRLSKKPVLVITAGTSDIPVAEEACVTAETMGCPVERLYDVGVAGIHRLLGSSGRLEPAGAIVVAAGMEGALASVVGGLTGRPIVAVPTSVGYGASFNGLSALLGMLNTCSPGVAVVNIDNGFGAGYFAAVVCRESGLVE
ncbi:MAG: nickel pincer cofactor biosynthesis protein LarB [bacterium]